MWAWRETAEDIALRRYWTEVTLRLAPDFLPGTIERERTEACAVDLAFSGIGSGTPSPNGRRFLMLDALDRGGRVVDRDWVGQQPSGAPKTLARLRAPGIAEVRWAAVPGQPAVQRIETKWVLSEDYCRGEGWTEAGDYWFVADPEFHDASQVKVHYLPFRAGFDPDKVADAIGNLLLGAPEIKELFQPGQDVYAMVRRSAAFAEADDARAGEMRASLLQALIASGVDPVMARILGLYGFVDAAAVDDKRLGDILIEADLPFFDQANLEAIDLRLGALLPEAGGEFFRNAGYFLEGQRLSALVLAAGLEKRPEMDKPQIQPTEMSVAVVPAQGADPVPQILVQTRTDVALDPFEVRPELTPVAYLVERQVSGQPYQNVAEGRGRPIPWTRSGCCRRSTFRRGRTPPGRRRCASPTISCCRICCRRRSGTG